MERTTEEENGKRLRTIPSRLQTVSSLLRDAGHKLKTTVLADDAVWRLLARASVKSRYISRDVSERMSSDSKIVEAGPLSSLLRRLGEINEMWADVRDYLRFGFRVSGGDRSAEPVSARTLRITSDRIARERRKIQALQIEDLAFDEVLRLPAASPTPQVGKDEYGPRRATGPGIAKLPELLEVVIPSGIGTPAWSGDPSTAHPSLEIAYADYVKTRRLRVWFGTNRGLEVSGIPDGSSSLSLGFCQVHVPRSHTVGSLGSGWIKRVIRKARRLEDDRLKVEATRVLEEGPFKAHLASALSTAPRKNALVVVHGYNVSFDEAARRTAQIGFDLRIEGVCTFFSWRSRGSVLRYWADEDEVQIAEKHFIHFVECLLSVSEIEEIHLLAHSMGNRLLLRSLQRMSLQGVTRDEGRIGQIVLAASDVPQPLFADNIEHYLKLANRRVTSYSCTRDVPLFFSKLMHGHRRVGLEPPIFTHEKLDSVSAADLDLHGFGHGYYADVEPVVHDIAQLVHHDTPPSERDRIERALDGPYWRLQKHQLAQETKKGG